MLNLQQLTFVIPRDMGNRTHSIRYAVPLSTYKSVKDRSSTYTPVEIY